MLFVVLWYLQDNGICVVADDASSVLVQSTRLQAKLNSARVHQMCAQATHLLSLLVAVQALPGRSGKHSCSLTVMTPPLGWQHVSNFAVNLCCYTSLQLCAGIQVTVPAHIMLHVQPHVGLTQQKHRSGDCCYL